LTQLAAALDVAPAEVFYTWAQRKCGQRGQLGQGAWVYFFHGLECDLRNTDDGRLLRVDFGPEGRVDTVTAWGVLQLAMTSVTPWREFRRLKTEFVSVGAPPDPYAGDLRRFGAVWDRLESAGCFETTAPQLLELERASTTIGEDGIRRVRYSADTPERVRIDCSVAHRKVLSSLGRGMVLESRRNGLASV